MKRDASWRGMRRTVGIREDMAHLNDLVYSILYITSQGGCDGVGKVGDPERFCNIL
jgi:hypothetical protein